MPIQVVDMTTLLNISGISSGSEVNVIFNMYQTCLRERWRMGGICIFTHRGTGKQIPFKKKNRRVVVGTEVKGTKYFYTYHCLAFVNSRL
jgi:hypothetical protein